MKRDDWAQVEALFARIAALPEDQQASALESCSASQEIQDQVRELLAFDGRLDLDQWGQSVQRLASSMDQQELCGKTLGPWRMTRPLGEGGMGRVFLAERCDGRFDAQAAIKFVTGQAGRDIELFDRERRILARLSHPGIARIIDAGEDETLGAYLVMEYVDGRPLDQVVTEDGLNAFQIAEWMSRAARIVAHAHQNLVLHRDLKPDHLMVNEQQALKILDFGVASLLNQEQVDDSTNSETRYTPRYAAPEQLDNLPATTRTDVYALGLILFELLTGGSSPFAGDPATIERRKRLGQAEPLPPLEGLSQTRAKDLQAIVKRCLSADPDQRYPGPADLARDLSAFCLDRAVSARAPAWSESTQRWLRHNRLAGAALGIAVIALVAGTVVSTWFGYQARLERDAAIIETTKAREIAEFLESVFQASTPGLESGPDVRARDLLGAGEARIDQELANQPEVAAALELAIARSYLSLGLYEEALDLVSPPISHLPIELQTDRRLLKARLLSLTGRYADAAEVLDRDWIEQLNGNTRAHAHNLLATALLNMGQTERAESIAHDALSHATSEPEGLATQLVTQGLLGAIAFNRQNYDQAVQVYSEIHSLNQRRHGPVHEETAQALHNLATVLFMNGEVSAAALHYEEAVTNKRAYYGVDNRSVAMSLRSLGLSYRRLGDAQAAEKPLREAISALGEWNTSSSAVYQEAVVQLMELLAVTGRESELPGLLESLPELPNLDGAYAKDIYCRVHRFRQTFLMPASLIEFCEGHRFSAPSSQAFDLFLRALAVHRTDPSKADEVIGTALEHTNVLTPADPLLQGAIQRLSQSR